MTLKSKIILLTVIPLLLATAIITYLGVTHAKSLTQQELALYEQRMIETRKQALKDNVAIAMSAIRPILNDPTLTTEQAKLKVRRLLTGLTYNEDGYFFAYTLDGVNLVHPTQPDFVGQNLLEFQDREGDFLIKNLIGAAKSGGGFHRYIWEKPPQLIQEDKLSYVVLIEQWGWMMGTGLYLDDIYRDLDIAQNTMNKNISNSLFTVLFVLGLTVTMVLLLGLFINLREHRLADARLKKLIQRFIRLQISERRKFSRELHDGINQLLVSSKFRIELVANKLRKGVQHDTIEADLQQAEHVIEQTIQEVRQISHNLRPTLLDDLGLEAALIGLLEQFSERTQIRVQYQLMPNLDELAEEVEITLYRLSQECLTNIEKHANAESVSLKIWLQKDALHFECRDDGCGFNPRDHASGIGVFNMRERLALIEGEFSIHSEAELGTTVRAFVPSEIAMSGGQNEPT